VLLQLVLSICFPVLGLTQVLYIRGEEAAYWAIGETRGGRLSALGIFLHPGNLALFICISSAYFLSSYLLGYKKFLSLLYLVTGIIVLYLTLARSGWLAFIAMFCVMIVAYKNSHKSIFSLKNILMVSIFLGGLLFVIIFYTPLGEYFMNEDFEDMAEARIVHWMAGLDIFTHHPIFGVGINSHLYYFRAELPMLDGFYVENPIHNIHIILLAETGLTGLLCWIFFIVYNMNKSQSFIISPSLESSILNFTFMGIIVAWFIYGFFGWAPFQIDMLSLFLFLAFFAIYSRCKSGKSYA
jgi:O-antigen ligase